MRSISWTYNEGWVAAGQGRVLYTMDDAYVRADIGQLLFDVNPALAAQLSISYQSGAGPTSTPTTTPTHTPTHTPTRTPTPTTTVSPPARHIYLPVILH